MLIHIRQTNLPQIACGLYEMDRTRVLNIILQLFANTDIRVETFLQKVRWNSNFDNAPLGKEYSID